MYLTPSDSEDERALSPPMESEVVFNPKQRKIQFRLASSGSDTESEGDGEMDVEYAVKSSVRFLPKRSDQLVMSEDSDDDDDSVTGTAVREQKALEKSQSFLERSQKFLEMSLTVPAYGEGIEAEEDGVVEIEDDCSNEDIMKSHFVGQGRIRSEGYFTADELFEKMFGEFSSEEAKKVYLRMIVMTHNYLMPTEEFVSRLIEVYNGENATEETKCRVLRCLLLLADLSRDFEDKEFKWLGIALVFVARNVDTHKFFVKEFLKRAKKPVSKLLGMQNAESADFPSDVVKARNEFMRKSFGNEWTISNSELIGRPVIPRTPSSLHKKQSRKSLAVRMNVLDPETAATVRDQIGEVLSELDYLKSPDFFLYFIVMSVAANKGSFQHSFVAGAAVEKATQKLGIDSVEAIRLANELLKRGSIMPTDGRPVREFENDSREYYCPGVGSEDYLDVMKSRAETPTVQYDTHFKPIEFARQLAMVSHDFASRVRLPDVRFDGKGDNHGSSFRNVTKFTIFLSRWISLEVLNAGNSECQGKKVAYFVDVLKRLVEMGDMNSASAIAEGLSHPAVTRIPSIWRNVNEEKRRAIRTFAMKAQEKVDYSVLDGENFALPYFPKLKKDVDEVCHTIEFKKDQCFSLVALDMAYFVLNSLYMIRHTPPKTKPEKALMSFIISEVKRNQVSDNFIMAASHNILPAGDSSEIVFHVESTEIGNGIFEQRKEWVDKNPDFFGKVIHDDGESEDEKPEATKEVSPQPMPVVMQKEDILNGIFAAYPNNKEAFFYIQRVVFIHKYIVKTNEFVNWLIESYLHPASPHISEEEARCRVLRCFLALSNLILDFGGDRKEWLGKIIVFIARNLVGTCGAFVNEFLRRGCEHIIETLGICDFTIPLPPVLRMANKCAYKRLENFEWTKSNEELMDNAWGTDQMTDYNRKLGNAAVKALGSELSVEEAARVAANVMRIKNNMFLGNEDILRYFLIFSDFSHNDKSGTRNRFCTFDAAKVFNEGVSVMSKIGIMPTDAEKRIADMGNMLIRRGVIETEATNKFFNNDSTVWYFTKKDHFHCDTITRDKLSLIYSVLDIPPNDMAGQITTVAHRLFAAIPLDEISFGNPGKVCEKPERYPNLSKFNEFVDGLSRWTMTEILMEKERSNWKPYIKYFYDLTQAFVQGGNVVCGMNIAAGLCRLKEYFPSDVTDALPPKHWLFLEGIQGMMVTKVDAQSLVHADWRARFFPNAPQMWNDLVRIDACEWKKDGGYDMNVLADTADVFIAVKTVSASVFPVKQDPVVEGFILHARRVLSDTEINMRLRMMQNMKDNKKKKRWRRSLI